MTKETIDEALESASADMISVQAALLLIWATVTLARQQESVMPADKAKIRGNNEKIARHLVSPPEQDRL